MRTDIKELQRGINQLWWFTIILGALVVVALFLAANRFKETNEIRHEQDMKIFYWLNDTIISAYKANSLTWEVQSNQKLIDIRTYCFSYYRCPRAEYSQIINTTCYHSEDKQNWKECIIN